MKGKLIKIGIHFGNKMSEKNISAYAASTAFFIFLSLVPMLMVICTMIPYTPLTEENLTRAITEVTPNQIDSMVTQLIHDVYRRASSILPLAALVMIWTAAKGLMALMSGLNAVNGVQERRNYFVVRFIAAVYTVVMLIGFFMIYDGLSNIWIVTRIYKNAKMFKQEMEAVEVELKERP